MKKWILVAGLSLIASGAFAGEITIKLADDVDVTENAVLYKCGDQNVSATYYNAGDNSLVELEMENNTVIAANVLSGSGAKYAGGIYVWWTKGPTADLYNLMDDPEQEKPISCTEE
ncbi:MliC family protein [Brucella thiophenivorans]|uniref:Membrane-bound lysozyme-inhibitor of c-type lysozyme family protein n=1 Tax=Brucella thiophenivorans TaxID=571255 RepID=A0A256FZJ0_9HYPH|nr:MliC family protein [Brucella thiophenivorans]OYR20275.1 membrane-bound lysozyme-inhibitor of c-type lysozyme family protein [Brucella thiophenivorans]